MPVQPLMQSPIKFGKRIKIHNQSYQDLLKLKDPLSVAGNKTTTDLARHFA